jgi:UDP-N-acetyl-D-glucosamine dehydrogenase
MKVTVIGQGYVGLTLAVAAAESGLEVVGIDIDEDLISNLLIGNSKVPGITNSVLNDLIKSNKYLPTTDFNNIKSSKVVVIAVPTPVDMNRKPDLSFIIEACKSISKCLETPALIINESTSYPGTLRNLIKSTIEKTSTLEFEYAAAPERVDPANEKWHLSNTTRVVSGLTDLATERAVEFYSHFCNSIYRASSPEVAEAAKLFENTFRQVNIALVNEFSNIISVLNLSANEVLEAAASKPFGFMRFLPSIGAGGHCIPVDPEYLVNFAEKNGVDSLLISSANKLNFERPSQVVQRIEKYLDFKLVGRKIQVAGIAYKSSVSDIRESPALRLIQELRNVGAMVCWNDPIVCEWGGERSTPIDPSVDLGLVVTPHLGIDFDVWRKAKTRVIDLSVGISALGWPKIL